MEGEEIGDGDVAGDEVSSVGDITAVIFAIYCRVLDLDR